MLLSDADCDSFVGAHASDEEQRAYGLLRTGAQRADLFRILFLKVIGGVYADLDLELRTPLREVLPPQASLVAGSTWNFAFLAYQRNHVRRWPTTPRRALPHDQSRRVRARAAADASARGGRRGGAGHRAVGAHGAGHAGRLLLARGKPRDALAYAAAGFAHAEAHLSGSSDERLMQLWEIAEEHIEEQRQQRRRRARMSRR